MRKRKKQKKGISLIEILIVMTIFSILAILATRGVLVTLRGSRKSDALGKVRENVDYSVSVMERQLRNASTVTCPSSTEVTYTDPSSQQATFTCEDIGSDGYVASSSARLTTDEVEITQCSFTCDQGGVGVSPSVTISLTGADTSSQGVEAGNVTVSTKIFLRTY